MPLLNPHPVYFPQAVRSVLQQTLTDLELIIIEDPSPRSGKGLLTGLEDPRLRHIVSPSRTSLIAQRNRGLAEARADLVALQDADDISEPDRLQKQAAYLHAHPEIAVLGTQLRIIDDAGKHLGYRAYPGDHDAILRVMPRFSPLAQPSVMLRKSIVLEAGGYEYDHYTVAEDYDLWSRLAARGVRFANYPEALVRYRLHAEAGKTTKLREMLLATIDVKKRHWSGRMDLTARLRLWAERALLWLPPGLVLALFRRYQFQEGLPSFPREAATAV
jgi:glycosyltransferase involved in cell wall biosynthesis